MQTNDDLKNNLQKMERSVKRVKRTEKESNNSIFTPLANSKKPFKDPNFSKRVLGVWIRLSQQDDYDFLAEKLKEFGLLEGKEAISNFFRAEGACLLISSMLYWENFKHLQFIYERVPQDLLRELIKKDNYSLVRSFLLGQSFLEQEDLVNENKLKERQEKLKILVKIDPEGLREYRDSQGFNTYFTDGVRKSFQKAVEKYKVTLPNGIVFDTSPMM